METLNVQRHQTADTSTSQADSNLQVTSANRRRPVPLSPHNHRFIREKHGRVGWSSFLSNCHKGPRNQREREEHLCSSVSQNIQSVLSEEGVRMTGDVRNHGLKTLRHLYKYTYWWCTFVARSNLMIGCVIHLFSTPNIRSWLWQFETSFNGFIYHPCFAHRF